jgi:hypothetical protein
MIRELRETEGRDTDKPSRRQLESIELVQDAWARFERAVDVVIKSGPKHRQRQATKDGRTNVKATDAR